MKIRKKRKKMPYVADNETDEQVMMSLFDPNGSYTGVPLKPDEERRPIQDADDL